MVAFCGTKQGQCWFVWRWDGPELDEESTFSHIKSLRDTLMQDLGGDEAFGGEDGLAKKQG